MPQQRVPIVQMQIMRTSDVRRTLTEPGDVKSEIAFQNDINALLARFEEVKVPWLPIAAALPALPVSVVADDTPTPVVKPGRRPRRSDAQGAQLRVVDGGMPAAPIDLLSFVPSSVRVVGPAATAPRPVVTVARTATRQPRRR
jgi:hypothetical protein